MIKLDETATIDRSVADCYRYLLDFSTIEQWDPGVLRAEKITPGAPRIGTEFQLSLKLPGGASPMRYRLLETSDNERLVLSGEGENFTARDEITLERIENTLTRIRYQADLHLGGMAGRASALLKPWLENVGRQAVTGLATALTDPSPPRGMPLRDRLSHRLLLPAMRDFTRRGYLRMPHKGLNQYIDGKTVVITGPTSGLGLATACELARLGARLILVGRDPQRLEAARYAIRSFSGRDEDAITAVEADLSLLSQVADAAATIADIAPRIDVLINNAGALFAERDETEEGFERCLAINLLAPYALTRALWPTLDKSRARVINVASGGMYLQGLDLADMGYAKPAYDGAKAYARAKRALVAVTEYWAAQTRNSGLRFHAMHPGWAATPGVANSLPEFNRRLAGRLRDGRMGADTICWLASTRSLGDLNGQFWFDRRPRPTSVIPGTAVSSAQKTALIDWLDQVLEAQGLTFQDA